MTRGRGIAGLRAAILFLMCLTLSSAGVARAARAGDAAAPAPAPTRSRSRADDASPRSSPSPSPSPSPSSSERAPMDARETQTPSEDDDDADATTEPGGVVDISDFSESEKDTHARVLASFAERSGDISPAGACAAVIADSCVPSAMHPDFLARMAIAEGDADGDVAEKKNDEVKTDAPTTKTTEKTNARTTTKTTEKTNVTTTTRSSSASPLASRSLLQVAVGHRSYFECVKSVSAKGPAAITPACEKDIRDAYSRRFADFRLDFDLASACGAGDDADVKKFCGDVEPGTGLVFRCLKSRKRELSPDCAAIVDARQIDQSEDVSLDAPLATMCEDDRANLCAAVAWGGGRVEQCLKDKRAALSPRCKRELFRREVEESEDVRFDGFLARACAVDRDAFCSSIPPGEARVVACLANHLDDATFTQECRSAMERKSVRRAADWRLDFRTRRACEAVAAELCARELEDAEDKISASGAVLECLKRNHAAGNVTDEACAADITRRMASSASDIRGDAPLVAACASDLKSHCAEVTPGEGKLWACLEKYESVLSPSCAAKLSERSQWAGEDWRANPKIAAACAAEASSLCADVKPGRGRVVECLRAAADAENGPEGAGMGAECAAAVTADRVKAAGDIRFDRDARTACEDDRARLCADVPKGEGRVLKCLRDATRAGRVKSDACVASMRRAMKAAAKNFELDAPLASACAEDVKKYCAGVARGRGRGRVHACLKKHARDVSRECAAAREAAEKEADFVDDARSPRDDDDDDEPRKMGSERFWDKASASAEERLKMKGAEMSDEQKETLLGAVDAFHERGAARAAKGLDPAPPPMHWTRMLMEVPYAIALIVGAVVLVAAVVAYCVVRRSLTRLVKTHKSIQMSASRNRTTARV